MFCEGHALRKFKGIDVQRKTGGSAGRKQLHVFKPLHAGDGAVFVLGGLEDEDGDFICAVHRSDQVHHGVCLAAARNACQKRMLAQVPEREEDLVACFVPAKGQAAFIVLWHGFLGDFDPFARIERRQHRKACQFVQQEKLGQFAQHLRRGGMGAQDEALGRYLRKAQILFIKALLVRAFAERFACRGVENEACVLHIVGEHLDIGNEMRVFRQAFEQILVIIQR